MIAALLLHLLSAPGRADTLHATLRLDGDRVELVSAVAAPGDAVLPGGDLEVLDDDGRVVGTGAMPPLGAFRSVLTPTGHETARVETRYLRVHLPWPEGARRVRLGREEVEVASDPRLRREAVDAVAERVLASGPAGERLDLVFFAEGYPAERAAEFEGHVDAVVDHLLGKEPWSGYTALFNVWRVFLPSAARGIDPSPTEDVVATPFECHYGCGLAGTATAQLICCDQDEIAAVVAGTAPFADGVMLLVDDDDYGGSGGLDYSTSFTGDARGLEVAAHELGHTLIGLWDEYSYNIAEADAEAFADGDPSDGITDIHYISPNCSPIDARVPWEAWLDEGPIEWPLWHAVRDLHAAGGFGGLQCDGRKIQLGDMCAFETCSFTDWVRPKATTCLMKDLEPAYCPVCREAIVRSFYRGLGGELVRSADPPVGSRVVVDEGETRAFTVDAAGPDAGLRWRWKSGDTVLHEGPDFVLDGSQEVCGTLSLELLDDTPWVRTDPEGLLGQTVTWRVSTGPCCGCAATGPAASLAPAWLVLAALRRRRRR